jgi:hypothetical protein
MLISILVLLSGTSQVFSAYHFISLSQLFQDMRPVVTLILLMENLILSVNFTCQCEKAKDTQVDKSVKVVYKEISI